MCPSLVPEEAELLISLHQSNSINSSTTAINTPKSTVSSIQSISSTDDKSFIDKSMMPKLEPLSPVSLTTTTTNTSPVNYNNTHAQQPIYTVSHQHSINQLQHNHRMPQQYTPLHPHNVIPYPSLHKPSNYTNKQFVVIPPSMIQLATPIQYNTMQHQQLINAPSVHNKSTVYTSKSTSADSTTVDTESDTSTNTATRKKKRLARKAELARLSRLRKKCKLNDLECNANDLKIRCQQQQTIIETLQLQIKQLQSNTNNNQNQYPQNNKYTMNDAIEYLKQYSQQSVSARLVSFMRLHHLDSNALVILAQSMRDVKITPEQLTKLHVTIKSSAAPTIECNQLLDTINKLSKDIEINDKYNQHCYEQLQSVMNSDQLQQLLKLINDTESTINLDQTI